jgi:hypothetical protein
VSLTFHTPSKALAARAAKLVTAKKTGERGDQRPRRMAELKTPRN